MLILNKNLSEAVVNHCRKELPDEACGILAGKDGKVENIYEMVNIEKSPSVYFMDPKEQFKVMKEIRGSELEMIGIYHSHIASQAYPSSHDIELAFYPDVYYVIISLKDMNNPSIRSFKIKEGKITEEQIKTE